MGFIEQSSGNTGGASLKLKEVNDGAFGEVVDIYNVDYVPFGKEKPEIDPRTGEAVQQVCIVIQTEWTNHERVAKIKKNDDGSPREDDGRRAIYARKGTNIYAALGKALAEAEAEDVEVGGQLGVKITELKDTGKGNPLKVHEAKYVKPKASSAGFFEKQEPVPNSDGGPGFSSDEPPF